MSEWVSMSESSVLNFQVKMSHKKGDLILLVDSSRVESRFRFERDEFYFPSVQCWLEFYFNKTNRERGKRIKNRNEEFFCH